MRTIKFRAWDETENKMISSEDLGHQTWNVLGSIQWGGNNWRFMQFTGLLDKNGKEIYEGDLVKNNDLVWELMWQDAGFYIKQVGKEFKWIFLRESPHSEVIGNIYENPELIKCL